MLTKIVDLTSDNLGKIYYVTIDTCSLKQIIWDYFSQDLHLSHIFYILCDFHGLSNFLSKTYYPPPKLGQLFI